MVKSEISSTLGLKTANCAPKLDNDNRLSHGESCTEPLLLRKEAFRVENAMPNVNPSDFWTVVSVHGEKTWLLSVLEYDVVARVVRVKMISIGIFIAGDEGVCVCVGV